MSTRNPSLDALRIIFEFLVVSFHVLYNQPHSSAADVLAYDLMSFFFILSGCVCMIKHVDSIQTINPWKYIRDKFTYVYPVYVFFALWQYLGYDSMNHPDCFWQNTCISLDFLMLSQWFNCGRMELDIPGTGWFISILFSCWCLFPFMLTSLHRFWQTHLWIKIAILYACLQFLSTVAWLSRVHLAFFTPVRVLEFVMGTGVAFTLQDRIPSWYIMVSVWMCIAFYLTLHYTLQWDMNNCVAFGMTACDPFSPSMERILQPPCNQLFRYFFSKASFLWVFLIQYVARHNFLDFQIFSILNPISFMLYISHVCVMYTLRFLTSNVGLDNFFMDPFMVLALYLIAYGMHVGYTFVYSQVKGLCEEYMVVEQGGC